MDTSSLFHHIRKHLLKTALVCIWLGLCLAVAPTKPNAGQGDGGIYSRAQARRGEALYDKFCAGCHGFKLEGNIASALAGEQFMKKWGRGQRTVDDLYHITRTQMPEGRPSSLTPQQYIDIVAYMLERNGYRSGEQELPAEPATLKKIVIKPQDTSGKVIAETGGAEAGKLSPAPSPNGKGPTQMELNAAYENSTDWLMSNHDYSGQRFVDLKQINPQNVASLRPTCIYQAGDTKAFHNNPIIYRGVMYITTTYSTIALDATNCRVRWRHDWKPKGVEGWPPNRGAAIKDGILVRGTLDGYLIALDMESGRLIWERKHVVVEKNEGGFNMAPLIYQDLVLIGPGVSENGIKGWIAAFKLETGEQVWRFNTVPDEGEPGAETWEIPDARLHGGGAVWSPLSLDPQEGLLYVPVSNPAPDLYTDIRPGKNLYTCSMVVLDVRTGKLKWYYQLVPQDFHDYDTTQASPLFVAEVKGKKRKLVATVGKDGLLHVVDRETREHLYEAEVTRRKNVDVPLTTEGVYVCPGVLGGVQWNGPAYNPLTNMLYVNSVDWCGTFKKAQEYRIAGGRSFFGGSYIPDPPEKSRGYLTAIDASTGRVKWRYESQRPMLAAVTTTSAGLVFTGELTGDMMALDAETGRVLYRFHTGGAMNGGVVTYALQGKQYVAVASGSASGFWQRPVGSSTIIIFSLP
jgi:alcohol dehydrogenase (cytochrome c)